ncbi:phage minor head protein [Pseudochrobactrum sp. MP213Fo]|uniref:phage minor head protein n=1 Tax=Pseudochrobactrum sp. MP213Fo TaxID=3022250 RepID=UPI003BA3DC6E
MARKLTEGQELEKMLAHFEPRMRLAFLKSVRDINDLVMLADIERLVEAGDIEGVIKALGVQHGAFHPMALTTEAAFTAGGIATMRRLPYIRDSNGAKNIFHFNARNSIAEKRLLARSSKMITNIADDTIGAIRHILTDGLKAGINPKQLSRQIVGAYDPKLKRRTGGIIGLNGEQAKWVTNARTELEFGSKGSLNKFLGRAARDKRYDAMIKRAIDGKEPLSSKAIDQIMNRYNDRLLKVRADTIGLTETMEALNSSKIAANGQIIDQLGLDPDVDAVKVWKSANDERTRADHLAMNGVEVIGMDEPFTLPDGSQMLHPCDSSLGAPASQTIRCRCTYFVRLDYLKGI